jgi:hypothetical protein
MSGAAAVRAAGWSGGGEHAIQGAGDLGEGDRFGQMHSAPGPSGTLRRWARTSRAARSLFPSTSTIFRAWLRPARSTRTPATWTTPDRLMGGRLEITIEVCSRRGFGSNDLASAEELRAAAVV